MTCWSNAVISSAQGLSDRSDAHRYNFINFLAQGYLLPCRRSSVPRSLVSCCSQHLNEVTIVHQGKMTHLTLLQDNKRSNNRAESRLPCPNQIKVLSGRYTCYSWETYYQSLGQYYELSWKYNSFWSILFWRTRSMLKISLIIFKGQTFWICWAEVCRIRLTSSVICLPQDMGCCLLAESEDSTLFYYYWTSFMLIINQFNNICHWKAPTIMLLHKHIYHPLSSLLQSKRLGETTASLSA